MKNFLKKLSLIVIILTTFIINVKAENNCVSYSKITKTVNETNNNGDIIKKIVLTKKFKLTDSKGNTCSLKFEQSYTDDKTINSFKVYKSENEENEEYKQQNIYKPNITCNNMDIQLNNPVNTGFDIDDLKCTYYDYDLGDYFKITGIDGDPNDNTNSQTNNSNGQTNSNSPTNSSSQTTNSSTTQTSNKGKSITDIINNDDDETDIKQGKMKCTETLKGTLGEYLTKIFSIMKYLGIILCIGMTIFDFIKALLDSDKEIMNKLAKTAFKRLILVAILFFLPTFINLITGFFVENPCPIDF